VITPELVCVIVVPPGLVWVNVPLGLWVTVSPLFPCQMVWSVRWPRLSIS
jgi:hypothetical protein